MSLELLPPITIKDFQPFASPVKPKARVSRKRATPRWVGRYRIKLPDPWQVARFAHPVEAEFARVLDFYRVHWQYEPHQFVLEWHSDGTVAKMFSPDFYLPDFDLYAELTTQRQALVTRKNAKLRRLRELYPDINIRLFYRKDLQRFLARFGIAVSSQTVTPPGGLAG